MHGDPRHDGNLRHLQQALGDVLVHADRGAENAGADEGKPREIEQALNRSVFAVRAVHHGKDHIEPLPAPPLPPLPPSGTSDALVGSAVIITSWPPRKTSGSIFCAPAPMRQWPSLVMPIGHRFVLIGIETANHGGCGGEGDFVFAGAAAEEDADAETFVWGHVKILWS